MLRPLSQTSFEELCVPGGKERGSGRRAAGLSVPLDARSLCPASPVHTHVLTQGFSAHFPHGGLCHLLHEKQFECFLFILVQRDRRKRGREGPIAVSPSPLPQAPPHPAEASAPPGRQEFLGCLGIGPALCQRRFMVRHLFLIYLIVYLIYFY